MKILSTLGIGLAATAFLSLSSVAEAKLETKPSSMQVPAAVNGVALTLVFSSVVNLQASVVKITDLGGNRVMTGNLRSEGNGRNVEIPLGAPLRPGVYSISWHVVSADGQDSVGGYDFTIDPIGKQTPTVAQQ